MRKGLLPMPTRMLPIATSLISSWRHFCCSRPIIITITTISHPRRYNSSTATATAVAPRPVIASGKSVRVQVQFKSPIPSPIPSPIQVNSFHSSPTKPNQPYSPPRPRPTPLTSHSWRPLDYLNIILREFPPSLVRSRHSSILPFFSTVWLQLSALQFLHPTYI